eukprot:TRINITY_DN7959_c0_g1_i1.p1 TRINITY_DN7959_c0_g1~~TRINITY_DN7959_c0_g1_i1.p1  ORF type:complete len:344 (+),score=53.57 TRINITY_DN7959_c0_g1_i1:155-1186(+)
MKVDRVFVIYLDKEEDEEFSVIQSKLANSKYQVEGFPCERPMKDFSNVNYPIRRMTKHFGTRSIVGCGWSHRRLWEKIASLETGNDNYYMVFESDADPVAGFEEKLGEFMTDVTKFENKYPDVAILGGLYSFECDMRKKIVSAPVSTLIKYLFMRNGVKHSTIRYSDNVREADCVYGTHAYMVNSDGAKKLLELLNEITFHVDFEISAQLKKGNITILSPTQQLVYNASCFTRTYADTYPVYGSILSKYTEDSWNLGWALNVPGYQLFNIPLSFWTIITSLITGLSSVEFGLLFVLLGSIGGNLKPFIFNILLVLSWCTWHTGVFTFAILFGLLSLFSFIQLL